MCRTCAWFYVYRGRHYENNDIFPKMRASRPTLLQLWPQVGRWYRRLHALTLSPERQSARMSKITNDGLTRFGTGCFCTHIATVGVKGLTECHNNTVGQYQPAGWLAAAAWAATVTSQACRNLISLCVFNNSGRWPKRASCRSSMQLPLVNQATKSSCIGPTGRNSLYAICCRGLKTKTLCQRTLFCVRWPHFWRK